MNDAPLITPQEGFSGMSVADLAFHRHELAVGADVMEDGLQQLPPSVQKSMAAWIETLKSTKHAVVQFPHGATISIITGIPAHDSDRSESGFGTAVFAKGDERVPTYEVSISVPEVGSEIRCYQTSSQLNAILAELAGQ